MTINSAETVFDHWQNLQTCKTFDEGFECATEYLRLLGISYWMTANCGWSNIQTPSQEVFFEGTYPKTVMTGFKEGNIADYDPTLLHVLKHPQDLSWREVDRICQMRLFPPHVQNYVEDATDLGLGAGISIPVHLGNARGGAGLAAQSDVCHDEFEAHWTIYGSAIRKIVEDFHVFMLRFPIYGRGFKLPPSQIEVLSLKKAGYSPKQIANLLGKDNPKNPDRPDSINARLGRYRRRCKKYNGWDPLILADRTRQI